ncbi:ribosome-binding protein 1-like [Falco rusticolus]|nr:ribosome-binding protein 1-like [Falco rusticolus]
MARLQESCGKLLNVLSEKSKVLQQEEQQRKSLELKAAALQMQMEQLQEELEQKLSHIRIQTATKLQELLKVTRTNWPEGQKQ